MFAVRMSSIKPERELSNEQETPAEETVTEFNGTVKKEEEINDWDRLQDLSRTALHRTGMKQCYTILCDRCLLQQGVKLILMLGYVCSQMDGCARIKPTIILLKY